MLGNFSYSNPTRLYFGDDAISFLGEELKNYGKKVMLTYGGGSIKKNGLYDEVLKALKDARKEVFEDPRVMSNPTVQKLYEGCRIAKGKSTDWEVHMIGQAIGAYTDATHGMTLSAVSLPYYRHIMPYGLHKFVRFAKEVWDIRTEDMSERDAAEAGLAAMESWMKEIGVVLSAKELGVSEDMIDGIADATFLFDGGYKALTRDEVVEIVKESL